MADTHNTALPYAWAWRNLRTGAQGVYFENPEQFGVVGHEDYEWTVLYTAPQPVSGYQQALDIRTAQGWTLSGKAVPVLYTDTINGEQVLRDDVWLCTTEALKPAPQPADAPDGWVNVDERLPKCPSKPGSVGVEVLIYPPLSDGSITAFYGRRQSTKPAFYKYGALVNGVEFWMAPPTPPTLNASKEDGNG